MMTENNFFTHIQKWAVCKAVTTEPPKFFRQSFDLADKTFVPYDELSSWKNGFLEMLKRIEPSKICWYDRIPDWISNYYDIDSIIVMKKRHKAGKERKSEKVGKMQPCLF